MQNFARNAPKGGASSFGTRDRIQKKLYDWIKRVSVKLGAAGLHWGLKEPPGGVEVRVERAFREWTQRWAAGPKIAAFSGKTLTPVAAPRVEEVAAGKFVILAALRAGLFESVGAAAADPVPCDT